MITEVFLLKFLRNTGFSRFSLQEGPPRVFFNFGRSDFGKRAIVRYGKCSTRNFSVIESDNQLLHAFLNQDDHEAFEQLVRRHSQMVFGLCVNILANRQDAEDAFQTTFMLLSMKAAKLSSYHSIGGWLHETCLRTCLCLRRKLSRKREVNVETIIEKTGEDHWEQIATQNQSEQIHQEIATLPASYRDVIILCHLDGMTRNQAAEILDTTAASVKSTLTRARKLLRSKLLRRGVATTAITSIATGTASASAAAQYNISESLIQSTLHACNTATGSAGNAAQLATLSQAPQAASSLAGSAMAVAMGMVLAGVGSIAMWNGNLNRPTQVAFEQAESAESLFETTPVNLETFQESDEPQQPATPVQDPEPPEQEEEPQVPARPLLAAPAAPGQPMAPAVGFPVPNDSQTSRARLNRVIDDLQRSVQLSDEQRKKLAIAAKGAMLKIKKSREELVERLGALQRGEVEDLTREELTNEMRAILNDIYSPKPAEESEFWTNELDKVLTAEQLQKYTELVAERMERTRRARINSFVASVDNTLLLSSEAVEKLTEFVEERYQPGSRAFSSNQNGLTEEDREELTRLLGESAMNAWSEDLDYQISELIYK